MGLLDEMLGGVLGQMGQGANPAGRGAGGGLGGLGGLGGMLGGNGGGQTGGGANALVLLLPVVLKMLQQNGGAGGGAGLAGLVEKFQSAGLGQHADSWVGTGQNMPLSAEQLLRALGPGQVGQIATQAGVSEAEASEGLAGLLPNLVNGLTPQGRVPQADALEQDLSSLLGQLNAR
jgi:uncharacterized protein YidB (DUF937 family)